MPFYYGSLCGSYADQASYISHCYMGYSDTLTSQIINILCLISSKLLSWGLFYQQIQHLQQQTNEYRWRSLVMSPFFNQSLVLPWDLAGIGLFGCFGVVSTWSGDACWRVLVNNGPDSKQWRSLVISHFFRSVFDSLVRGWNEKFTKKWYC